MRLFGRELTFKRATGSAVGAGGGGWWPLIREPYAGAWQKNDELEAPTVLAHYAVYACVTQISNDVGKLRSKLVQLDENGIWKEVVRPDYSKLLRKPNHYQNHIQFKQWWLTSKLIHGNTYGLKVRDNRGNVTAIYLLDPTKVTVLVSPSSEVFYQCNGDDLNELGSDGVTVPASEIIHDRMNCLFHPLVGISPLYACALSASQSLKIQHDSVQFFKNGAKPGGILSAPGAISDETATRLKAHWDQNYSGANSGRIAVVGDNLKFEAIRMSASDSQMIEQLKLTGEMICTAFHIPPFKVGIGSTPAGQKVSDLNQIYYDDCLQSHIEEMEASLDNGLSLPDNLGVELDLDGLLRMDAGALVTSLGAAVGASIMAPNEARRRLNLSPVEGGESPMIQQQNYSLAAISRRDAQADPFNPTAETPVEEPTVEDQARMLALLINKELNLEHA